MNPEEFAAEIGPVLMNVGQAFYFHPDTLARGKELGLDGFRFYGLGRGGVLGDVEAPVIQSAFAYFSLPLLDKIWNSAREVMAPRDAAREYLECCKNFGRKSFSDVEGLDAFNDAARAVNDAADPTGYALYAGCAAEPLADDAPGQAMQLATTLRELRGGAHLVAVLASGLTPLEAHAMKRPDDLANFGWAEEGPPIDDSHRQAFQEAEALTNRLVAPAFAVLDNTQADAMLSGAKAMQAALSGG